MKEVPTNPITSTARLNAVIDRELYKRFKMACMMKNENVTQVITRFIKSYLGEE